MSSIIVRILSESGLTIRGVTKITSSRLVESNARFLNSSPMIGMCPRPGSLLTAFCSSWLKTPERTIVSPWRTVTLVFTFRVRKPGTAIDPPKVTVVIDKSTFTRRLIEASGSFALSVPCRALADATFAAGSLSGARHDDKFADCGLASFAARRRTNAVWLYLVVLLPVAAAIRADEPWLVALAVPALLLPSAAVWMTKEDDPIDADRAPRKRRPSAA